MLLCKKITESQRKKPHRNLKEQHTFTIYDSIKDADVSEWNSVIREQNLFLSVDYLKLVEETKQKNYHFRYVVIYEHRKPVAVAYFQVIDFGADIFGENVAVQLNELKSKRIQLFGRYLEKSKGLIFRLVTLGNNFVSGEHGVAFAGEMSKEKQFNIICELAAIISKEEKLHGRISATLVKDFYSDSIPGKNPLTQGKFLEFAVEPNMVVEVPNQVKSLSEYVATFSKKYRNRAKSIFKLSAEVEKRELNASEVEKYNDEMFHLYEQVYNKAKFRLVKLHKGYFGEAKKMFGDNFIVNGFFYQNKLVAFYSCFLLPERELEAHFIGFDYKINKELELYQNILYSIIATAITHNRNRVNLGRTAAEIKSTVGAKANDLICYVKPQNHVSKMVLSPFINFLRPSEWIPRNPFKEEVLA